MNITYTCNICGASDLVDVASFDDKCPDCESKDVQIGDDTSTFVANSQGVAVRTALPFAHQPPHTTIEFDGD